MHLPGGEQEEVSWRGVQCSAVQCGAVQCITVLILGVHRPVDWTLTIPFHGAEHAPPRIPHCRTPAAPYSRGPPKGYIEAIENRMHRMEALLGGLLNNDDPRAQALLEE